MLAFFVRRLIGFVITMILVSIMVFIIMELPPGDYAERYAFRKYSGTGTVVTEADIDNIRIELGLDRPAPVRYVDWISGIVLRGDFGQAFAYETSVNKVLGERIWFSLAILFVTLLFTYIVAIPIGIIAAVGRNSALDYGLTVFSYLGLALPNFLIALVLLYFSVTQFDTDVGGLFSEEYENAAWSWARVKDLTIHIAPAAIVLAWSATAFQLQTVRATMLDEINQLSVTAARARGISEARLLTKYPARLAITPVISTIGFDINRIFSELPIVALVLGMPELGELLISSYIDGDTEVAGAILLILTTMIVVMNLVSDMLLALVDPRVRLQGN